MEEISLDTLNLNPSSDFGGGVEYLLNDKRKDLPKVSIEDELREFEVNAPASPSPSPHFKPIKLNMENTNEPIKLGRDTVSMDTFQQSAEGFRHINDISIEQEMKNIEVKSKEEILKEKFVILQKLQSLETKGITLSKHYTMESSFDEMKGEYEYLCSERERKNSVQFQSKILTTLITGIEFLNSKFDPFDIKLDGFSESINENIEDYDEIFSELAEKYKSKAKMAPELKLLFQLASAGIMVHMTNTMFKSAVPGMDDIMRQNPDLMQQFTKMATQTMEKTKPGVSQFVNEFQSRPEPRQEFRQESRQDSRQDSRQESRPEPRRPDMNGPENINSILSGMKRNVNMEKNESLVSLEDVSDLNVPAVSKKNRRKSDKNTISIVI
jgi:hypothetical protein